MAILLRIIKPYDRTSQLGILTRLNTTHAKLIGIRNAAMLTAANNNPNADPNVLLDESHFANFLEKALKNDDDGRNVQHSDDLLPFYYPTTREDSATGSILTEQPVQLATSNNEHANKPKILCVSCSDPIGLALHPTHDGWVYSNAVVLNYNSLLSQCKAFLLHLKQFKHEKEKLNQKSIDHINRGGFLNRDSASDTNKANKEAPVAFTREEEKRIESALQPLLKRYTTEHYTNHLIHYEPCFHSILKEGLKYTNGE